MKEKYTLDINEVCRMLGTTSRTLRYYEQKGIIKSTAVPFQTRRRYDAGQIKHIKNILVLRSLGLSVAKIQQLQKGSRHLTEIIAEHKAELIASIVSKSKEIRLLDEALSTIEKGGDIFAEKTAPPPNPEYDRMMIAEICTDAFISGEMEKCFSYFSDMLRDYMPLTAFCRIAEDTLTPIGGFVCKDRIEQDREYGNVIYSYLKYEKLGLYIKFVFAQDKIHGIWLNYYVL